MTESSSRTADLINVVLEHAQKTDKPNFTQCQLVLQSLNADPHDFRVLRQVMEQRLNLSPTLDALTTIEAVRDAITKTAITDSKFNFTQYQLRLQEFGELATSEDFATLRRLLTVKFKLPEVSVQTFLADAEANVRATPKIKNNYTQLQLVIQEQQQQHNYYSKLCVILEEDYKLTPILNFSQK